MWCSMNDKELDDKLTAATGRLATAMKPERDLWPGIEAAITQPATGRGWQGVFAQAAAIILLIGGSSGLTYLAVHEDRDPTVPGAPYAALQFQPVSGSFGSQYNLGPNFQDARNDLATMLQDALQKLAPETRAEVEKNMAAIHQAIVEINRALDKQPDNALLQELLLSTYRQELALMSSVDGMTSIVMRRNDI